MPLTGEVQISILDGGSVVTTPQSIQVVIGCSSTGTAAQVVASQNPQTFITNFGYGPLVEAATLSALAGATVLAIKATSNTPGASSAVTFTGTGTSVITVTGTANDSYLLQFLVVAGGTVGTTGITFQVSLDAGRNFGPVLALGIATTYVIPQTGLTLNFAAGTLVAGDTAKISTSEPLFNTAGIQACLNALQASQYASAGWGSMLIAGGSSATNFAVGVPGADATTIEGYLDTLATGYIFGRAMIQARDAKIPVAWGGSAETESAWITAITTDYSGVSARRINACAGHYNMPSGVPNPTCGAPRYRRPLAWALAARRAQIPPQRHAGRVRDGSLTQIVVDPTNDPKDGFVYHDERVNSGLDAARFTSATTRIGPSGVFIKNPNLMSPLGSVFVLQPHGDVMDVACSLVHQVGLQFVNADLRVNPSGTIYENEARAIEAALSAALQQQMVATNMISSFTVAVDRTTNVLTTSTININLTITARGYVLQENVTIGYVQSAQATGS